MRAIEGLLPVLASKLETELMCACSSTGKRVKSQLVWIMNAKKQPNHGAWLNPASCPDGAGRSVAGHSDQEAWHQRKGCLASNSGVYQVAVAASPSSISPSGTRIKTKRLVLADDDPFRGWRTSPKSTALTRRGRGFESRQAYQISLPSLASAASR